MSIYPDLDLPHLERLHDDLESGPDPLTLFFSLCRAEIELSTILDRLAAGMEPPSREPVLPEAVRRHLANFLLASRERAAHFKRLQAALDSKGKQARRARRLAPHVPESEGTVYPDWCTAPAPKPPCGSFSLF